MKKLRLLFANNKTALGIKVGALFLAVLLLYHQDLTMLGNEAIQSDLASHVLIVPFILMYVVYRRRKILRAVIPLEMTSAPRRTVITEVIGGMLCLLAFLLYWQGSHTFYPLEYHMVSLPLFVAGCILIIFNFQTLKALVFPIALLFLLTPPHIETIQTAGASLAAFSSQAAYWILKAMGLPVKLAVEYGNPVILLERTPAPLTFTVDIACAGIYSLIAFTVFALFAAYVTRGPAWKKVPVFLIGFPLVYALNITRIILIVLIGMLFGQQIAMGLFHLFGGWFLILVGTFLLLYFSEKIFKIRIFTARSNLTRCSTCTKSLEKGETYCFSCGKLLKYPNIKISRRHLLKIATLLISLAIVLPLSVPVFTLTEGPVEIITQSPSGEQVSTQILPEIEGYSVIFVFRDKTFEKRAHQDASLVYMYIPAENSTTTPIFVPLEIGGSYDSLHRWETCILWPQTQGLNRTVRVLDQRDVQILQNPPIIGRFFAFQPIGSDVAVTILYWYGRGVFNTGSGAKLDYIKTSLVVYIDPEEYFEAEERLLPFAKTIADYWQPIKTWPWVVIVLATEGKTIMAITIIFLAAILAFQVHKRYEQRKSNLEAYKKLMLEQEKLVLLAVHQAGQKNKPVGNAIASSYRKLAGKPIERETLNRKLSQAEEAGFVRKEVVSQEDEPVIVWKSLISFPSRSIL